MHDLHGPVAQIVDGRERVALVDEVFAGGAEIAPYVQRQQFEAALRGRLEDGQLQDFPVQVHGHVAPELLRELLERLKQKLPIGIGDIFTRMRCGCRKAGGVLKFTETSETRGFTGSRLNTTKNIKYQASPDLFAEGLFRRAIGYTRFFVFSSNTVFTFQMYTIVYEVKITARNKTYYEKGDY